MTTTATYTRAHRQAVSHAWKEMVSRLGGTNIELSIASTDRSAAIPTFDQKEFLQQNGLPKHRLKEDKVVEASKPDREAPIRATIDEDTTQLLPRLVLNVGTKHLHWCSDLSNLTGRGSCIGCGWGFRREQVLFIYERDEVKSDFHRCTWAFKKVGFPEPWAPILEHPKYFKAEESSSSDSDSSSSDSSSSEEEEHKKKRKNNNNVARKKTKRLQG